MTGGMESTPKNESETEPSDIVNIAPVIEGRMIEGAVTLA